ncbi:hypothetical protein E2C01_023491 [Portunus trituberculatus]|uniref:Uncharacterized protein n=1 Tax=Portunus trituberculatus TaxID=210409 RepID=A0A5B7E843_PORTR|nr:hypothetical protein [Portunus trituberculatus]
MSRRQEEHVVTFGGAEEKGERQPDFTFSCATDSFPALTGNNDTGGWTLPSLTAAPGMRRDGGASEVKWDIIRVTAKFLGSVIRSGHDVGQRNRKDVAKFLGRVNRIGESIPGSSFMTLELKERGKA